MEVNRLLGAMHGAYYTSLPGTMAEFDDLEARTQSGPQPPEHQRQDPTKKESDNHEVQHEKESRFLKDSVIRLTKELMTLQNEKPQYDNIPISNKLSKEEIQNIVLPSWIMDSTIVSPLFVAYDDRIQELSSFIEHQGKRKT